MTPHLTNVGIAFCTPIPKIQGPFGPHTAPITVEWHRARRDLGLPTNINTVELFLDGMEVGDARSAAVNHVLKMTPRPEFLFFLDYDVLPAHDAVTKLLYRARHFPEHEVFAGVYCLKADVPEPLIYKQWGAGPFWDWTVGDLIIEGIVGVHMGLVLIRTALFARMVEKLGDEPLFKTINEQEIKNGAVCNNRGTEDLHFCRKAVDDFGAKILVDTSVLAGHQDIGTGRIYGLPIDSRPVKGAKWLDAKDAEYKEQKKALDLGAGATRREWPDHKTYTTDIRSDTKPDYVMDMRKLNLPSDHFDLVASSHSLEHIGRWEQEEVWGEIFRITKPGGSIEHIVPTVEWAAHKIAAGETDEHVLNVLYGAQEAHGYERVFNTHFFGYTKAIGQALAESAGFVDVTAEDWRDNADLGYNLVLRGRKPEVT